MRSGKNEREDGKGNNESLHPKIMLSFVPVPILQVLCVEKISSCSITISLLSSEMLMSSLHESFDAQN